MKRLCVCGGVGNFLRNQADEFVKFQEGEGGKGTDAERSWKEHRLRDKCLKLKSTTKPVAYTIAWLRLWSCDQHVAALIRRAFRQPPEQVMHTHVPLSPGSIIWYEPEVGNAGKD